MHARRRVYKGRVDLPKSNQERTIALPPPARDVLLRQPRRHSELVFLSKRGGRLSAPTLTGYWARVKAKAGLEFDFYLATKHYGLHLLFKRGVLARTIGEQMGWSGKSVTKLLRTYGHASIAALEEIDRLYQSDASQTQPRPSTALGIGSVTELNHPRPSLVEASVALEEGGPRLREPGPASSNRPRRVPRRPAPPALRRHRSRTPCQCPRGC